MARKSAGTTSNYALYNLGNTWTYGASNAFTFAFHIKCADWANGGSAAFVWHARVAGGGDYHSVVLGQSTSKSLSLVTAGGGELTASKIDMTGTDGTWQFVAYNKVGGGNSDIDLWRGASGSISGANKIGTISSSAFYTGGPLTPNRIVMFAGWSGGDAIVLPFTGSIERFGVWLSGSRSDANIISLGNGSIFPSDLPTNLADSWKGLNGEVGAIVDNASTPYSLSQNGTIGTEAGPFDSVTVPEFKGLIVLP